MRRASCRRASASRACCSRASRTRRPARFCPRGFHVDIPPARIAQAKAAAAILGKEVYAKFPFAGGTQPMADDNAELILNRTWRPQLAVIGAEGLPVPANAGATLLPSTSLKLSLRLPPMLDSDKAMALMTQDADRRSALRRRGDVGTADAQQHRLERARARALARGLGQARRPGRVRPADGVHGRGRHDPLHGDARREIPRDAVRDHRRARPRLERARPERIPAHPDGQTRLRNSRAGARRPRPTAKARASARHVAAAHPFAILPRAQEVSRSDWRADLAMARWTRQCERFRLQPGLYFQRFRPQSTWRNT